MRAIEFGCPILYNRWYMFNNNHKFKAQAILLRKRGLSYREIRVQIPVAKSTLSLWLKSVPLDEEQRKRLYTKQISILSFGSQSQKERRAREVSKIIEEAGKEINLPLSNDSFKLMGAALYWAEGSKKNGFSITNSDPYFILFMVRWVESIFGIEPKDLKARLNIYPQQSDRDIKKFWSSLTNIPFENFGKSYVKPLNKGYKKNTLYYGTVRVEVPNGTDKRHRTFGWLQAVLKEIESKVKLAERRWQPLKEVIRPVNLPNT